MTRSEARLRGTDLLVVGTTDWLGAFAGAVETQTEGSVRRVETAADALDAVRSGDADCVVSECDLDGTSGVALLREIREETSTVPVVLGTASGDEATASEAIAAGVTDYFAVDETEAVDEAFVERTQRAIQSGREAATRRDRARQFDASFHDADAAAWVLDPDGSLARVNRAAREMGDAAGSLVGEPFWTLPCWSGPDGARRDVRRLVERALDGESARAVVGRPPVGDGDRILDLSVRPVENERGALVSVVVEGTDVTERVELERDLRRSEKLHRVTLNNMTDTVLITDEAGAYTYVCPNVHFIFGYTADEIRDRGTIADLLGPDLFDREELAANGVLKNIECTATDKAGREHTLLVNVREVSIRDGTLLYSCRDITKRKQREQALATLQETARDFLYAEHHREIASRVVEDTPDVLDLGASAVHLFDADDNELRPVAHSGRMSALHGPLRTVHADDETLPGYSFVQDESLFFDDVHATDRLGNRATDLRSALYIPLGNHGVFVAGTDRAAAFDGVTRELADLFAATAEAALDRVTRESRLRDQERELQRQNERLTSLNRVNETIRAIDQALVRAETRTEVDHTVCEQLTDDDRFAFAWLGVTDRTTETVEPRAWGGDGQGYLDSQGFPVSDGGSEPAGRTAATGEPTLVANVAAALREESWRTDALSRDFLSVLSIPLAYNDVEYGVLTVYAASRDAFDDTTRAVLLELGETIASAISAIERKNALLTTSMTRVEFAVDDRSFVLSRLARDADCTLSYRGGVEQATDGSHVFVTVEDGSVAAVEGSASELVAVDAVDRVSAANAGGVLRLRLAEPFLAVELADHGAVFQRATADPTGTTLAVDVPESVELRQVTDLLEEAFTDVELRSKQPVDRSAEAGRASRFLDRLTDRQLEVIQTAYYSGFFDSPRESTGEDVAGTLGISSTAVYDHVRTAERELFSTVFDDAGQR